MPTSADTVLGWIFAVFAAAILAGVVLRKLMEPGRLRRHPPDPRRAARARAVPLVVGVVVATSAVALLLLRPWR